MPSPLTQDELDAALAAAGYLADETLVTALYLALELGKPLLLEGVPGVGKTEVANALAQILGRELIRLQCYEGIDSARRSTNGTTRANCCMCGSPNDGGDVETSDLYDREFLDRDAASKGAAQCRDRGAADRRDRPRRRRVRGLPARIPVRLPDLRSPRSARSGASQPVVTILTSNRTRELHDALRRRCLYHWIDYPERARERAIIELHAPGIAAEAAERLVDAVAAMRRLPLIKRPGIAEASTGRARRKCCTATARHGRRR